MSFIDDIPDAMKTKLQDIATRSDNPMEDIMADFKAILYKIQDDKQYKDNDARYRYANMVVWREYIARPPADPHIIMPIGAEGTRNMNGTNTSTIYAIIKGEKGIQRIVCRGNSSELYKEFTPFMSYQVKIGRFKNKETGEEGDFVADNRCRFENPKRTEYDTETVMQKLGIKTVTIGETEHSRDAISFQRSDGYTDRTDWRCVRGQIIRKWSRLDSGDERVGMGTYAIIDESIMGNDPSYLEDGTMVPPSFTVWVHPNQMEYGNDDECLFLGPISISKKSGDPQMNACLILPVYVSGGSA